uniref:Uncharacterized protein n=1 Tax=Cucumis melo TaxID=3656 RepID=A0A9I9CK75_CUCME
MELPTDEDLTLGLDEVEIGLDNAHTDHLEQVDASKNKKKKIRGLILMHDVTRIKSTGEKTVVETMKMEYLLARMGRSFNLSLDVVYIIISPSHMHLGRRGYANLAQDMDEILDKAPNEESPNDALTQALGIPKYGRRVRGVGGFITPTVYFHQAKPRKSNKEKVLENVVKEKNGIATSVPPVSLTSKKKVVEEEEVIATRPMTKNEVKASRPMTKEVEVTSEPSNLPIQLKYLDMLKGALMIFQSQNNLKKTRKTTFWKAVKSFVIKDSNLSLPIAHTYPPFKHGYGTTKQQRRAQAMCMTMHVKV